MLDNDGYGTERLLHPGDWEFNDIQPWQYHKLPEVLGGGKGYRVRTEGEFDAALNAAWEDRSGPSILQVELDPKDCSRALRAAGGADEQDGGAEIDHWTRICLVYTLVLQWYNECHDSTSYRNDQKTQQTRQ